MGFTDDWYTDGCVSSVRSSVIILPTDFIACTDRISPSVKLVNGVVIVFGFQSGKQKFPGFGFTHNWVKRSIFWELPYWKTNLLHHNLDVMHIEKNVFENIFNTVVTPGHRGDRLKINHKWKKNIYLASCSLGGRSCSRSRHLVL